MLPDHRVCISRNFISPLALMLVFCLNVLLHLCRTVEEVVWLRTGARPGEPPVSGLASRGWYWPLCRHVSAAAWQSDKVTQSYSSLTILLGLEFRGREQTLHCIFIMHISKLFSSLETSDKTIVVIPHPPEEDCHGRKMFWSLLY